MTQREKRTFLIQELIDEQPRYRDLHIPADEAEQKTLLRSLMNVRLPRPMGDNFLTVQDAYLREETARKGITDSADLTSVEPGIYRVLCSLSRLYRQCHSHLRRGAASAGLRRDDEKTRARGRNGQGENHARLQSALRVRSAYGRPDHIRQSDRKRSGTACLLLPFQSGAGAGKRHKKCGVLLYFYGRVSFPK